MRKILIVLTVTSLRPLMAQLPARAALADSSPAAIMARAGSRFDDGSLAIAILRGQKGSYSTAKRDELADSLAARAINNKSRAGLPSDSAGYNAAARALSALAVTGRASVGHGRAYDGALDRLIRIHRQAPVGMIRFRALCAMLGESDRERALTYVKEVATAPDSTARDAVSCLIDDAIGQTPGGPLPQAQRRESAAILRDVGAQHLVKDPLAVETLGRGLRQVSKP